VEAWKRERGKELDTGLRRDDNASLTFPVDPCLRRFASSPPAHSALPHFHFALFPLTKKGQCEVIVNRDPQGVQEADPRRGLARAPLVSEQK